MPKQSRSTPAAPETPDSGTRQVVVVARADVALRATSHGITSAVGADISALSATLADFNVTLRPLFGVSEERLQFNAMAAAEIGADVPDLSVFYEATLPVAEAEQLAEQLRQHGVVEGAYVKPMDEPPTRTDVAPSPDPAPPATPDFSARQLYLDAAPGGVDARYAWTVSGGRGGNVRVIDVEGAWHFTHEDLLQNQGGVIGGMQSTDPGWINHGTAVAGEISGDANNIGITGISPDANIRSISIFGSGQSSSAAIIQAANALQAGDIILIELHRPGPRFNFAARNDQRGYIAVEWWPDDFAAIRYATGRGVIVVEAGGNGAENLDDALYNAPALGFPVTWRNPFARGAADSGAVLVGAGAPPPGTHGSNFGPDRSRLDFSNWGSAIDVQGWGREVTTTGYGDLQGGANEDFWYTNVFSGTSSASPIIVGVLGCTQGMLRAANHAVLTPATARNLLRTTGSPQQAGPNSPLSQHIGNRPDLRQIVTTLNLGKSILKEIRKEKEFNKELKDARKEIKDKELFKELKDARKEIKEKEFNKELKDARKEIKEIKEFKEGKGIFEGGLNQRLDVVQPTGVPSVEVRLGQVEQTITQLMHFISGDLRPDLTASALSGEADQQQMASLSQQLAKNAADAKQQKDLKDVEKLSEY